MATLNAVFRNEREFLLNEWVKQQLESGVLRSDFITEQELVRECSEFLDTLARSTQETGALQMQASSSKPVLEFLSQLSRSRGRMGFTPSETALFVLSLKRPLFEALRKTYAQDANAMADTIWQATEALDALSLHTVETFMETREDIIRAQQTDMLELSTPVVQLWDGIVALPLIGTLDSNRTTVVMETLLQVIVQTRSEIAIIDITGVPTVDTQVAQHLLKTVAAARLMGADCIISGIRPQIAQTMVHLQIDLGNVTTKATMAEALKVALQRSGFAVVRKVPSNTLS